MRACVLDGVATVVGGWRLGVFLSYGWDVCCSLGVTTVALREEYVFWGGCGLLLRSLVGYLTCDTGQVLSTSLVFSRLGGVSKLVLRVKRILVESKHTRP